MTPEVRAALRYLAGDRRDQAYPVLRAHSNLPRIEGSPFDPGSSSCNVAHFDGNGYPMPCPDERAAGYDDTTPRGIGWDDVRQAVRLIPAAILVVLAVIGACALMIAIVPGPTQ